VVCGAKRIDGDESGIVKVAFGVSLVPVFGANLVPIEHLCFFVVVESENLVCGLFKVDDVVFVVVQPHNGMEVRFVGANGIGGKRTKFCSFVVSTEGFDGVNVNHSNTPKNFE
jgi:hypothetical protein